MLTPVVLDPYVLSSNFGGDSDAKRACHDWLAWFLVRYAVLVVENRKAYDNLRRASGRGPLTDTLGLVPVRYHATTARPVGTVTLGVGQPASPHSGWVRCDVGVPDLVRHRLSLSPWRATRAERRTALTSMIAPLVDYSASITIVDPYVMIGKRNIGGLRALIENLPSRWRHTKVCIVTTTKDQSWQDHLHKADEALRSIASQATAIDASWYQVKRRDLAHDRWIQFDVSPQSGEGKNPRQYVVELSSGVKGFSKDWRGTGFTLLFLPPGSRADRDDHKRLSDEVHQIRKGTLEWSWPR